MKKLRIIRYELLALLLLLAITMLEFTLNMPIGKSANLFFPCQEVIGDSFPCYGKWDVLALAFTLFIKIVLVAISIYKILMASKKKDS